MKRRMFSLFGLLALLLPLLAACGGPAAPKPTEAVPVETPQAKAEPTEAETPEAETPEGKPPKAKPTVESTPTEPALGTPLKTPALEFGVVAHLYYTDHERVLQLAQNAGFDWMRQQVSWKDTEGPEAGNYIWDQLDIIVNAANTYKRKLLISIVDSPSFYTTVADAKGKNGLPKDPKSLGNFVAAMAKRYGNKIQAYEIWNEQNLAHETGGHITKESVGQYVEILVEAYKRIKAVNPRAFVLAGAPSSTGVTDPVIALSDLEYYKAMYSYKEGIVKDYFDAQAVHPGGSANPPDTYVDGNPSTANGWTEDSTFYFRHVEKVREVMREYNLEDHQVWITEYGWATENVTPGYEFGNQVTLEQQADYIARAMQRTYEKYPWIGNMFLWNLNFAVLWGQQEPPQPKHEQASFAILNADWSPRPSYLKAQSKIAEIKAKEKR